MVKDKTKGQHIGLDGKPWKAPPGIRQKGSAADQANKIKTVDDTKDSEWQPMQPVVLDMSENFDRRYTEEENYRAYKLFNIIDTSGAGSITLRELKRCLMGDTFRTFPKRFAHPDTGFVLGVDEDDCVVIKSIEPGSPASLDAFLSVGLQIWKINGHQIPPNDPLSVKLAYRILMGLHDEPVEFDIVEPILIINKFSNILDILVEDQMYSVTLPVGAVYNLEIFESKMRLALRKCSKDLKHIHVSFDGKRRQAYIRSHYTEFKILFQTGPNYQRSCRYALGFASEDSDWALEHRGQPMVFDLALGVAPHEAEIVLTELFEKFDEDKSGEFEYEEFRDFFIRFLDTEESIQLLRDYAQYKFRDLEKEAYYLQQAELAKMKSKRHADLKIRESGRRKAQVEAYKSKSVFDAYGIRRRSYGDKRVENFMMVREKPKRGRVRLSKKKEVVEFGAENLVITHHEELKTKVDVVEEDPLANLTPEMRVTMRSEIRRRRKSQDLKRRLRLNEIFNAVASLNKQMRKDALQMMGALAATHMVEVHQAIQRATRTAVRTEETGINGITQLNVGLSHVIATPALIVTAAMFNGQVDNKEIELRQMPVSELHPAVQRYFLIRHSKRANAQFDSEAQHPAFFMSDYERQPSRHSSHGFGAAKYMEGLLIAGKVYREKHGIEAKWDHTPDWDRPYRPESVRFVRPEKLPKRDRVVGRMHLKTIMLLDLPNVNTFLPNSPFVTLSIGLHEDDFEFHERRRAEIAVAKTRSGKNPPLVPAPEFRASTEVSALSGETAMWDDLGWESRVRACDWLTVDVFSGSPRVNVKIGTVKMSSMAWINEPVSNENDMELFMPIMDGDIPTGQLRLTMKMDIGMEFDWFRRNYEIEQAKLKKERKFKKWLSRQTNAPKVVLPFPLKFKIESIELFDLVPIHLFTRNSPFVTIEFGDSYDHETDVKPVAGDKCFWSALNFETHLTHMRNNLVFLVKSDMTVIGRFNILGQDLVKLPRDKGTEYLHLHATLTKPPPAVPGQQTGRMVVVIKFDLALAVVVKPGDDETAILGGAVLYGEGDDATHGSMSTVTYGTNYTPFPPIGVLPVRCRIKYMAASDLPLVGNGKQGTYLKVACGRWNKVTPVLTTSKGQNVEWSELAELDWTFPVMDRFFFSIRVMSGDKTIGTFALTAKEFAEQPRNGQDCAEVCEAITDGSELVGKIKFVVSWDHAGDNDFVNHMFHEMLQAEIVAETEKAKKENAQLITGYGDTVALPRKEGADGFKFIETKPFQFDYLPHHPFASQPDAPPFRVTINSIMAVDLKSVHTFSKNSPELNAACGQFAAVAPALPNAGASAGWPELTWAFFMYEGSNFRVTVWSKEVVIGTAVITPTDLLRSPVDKIGLRDLLHPLRNENDTTGRMSDSGKLKISYNLESVHDEVPLDLHAYKPIPISIEPPILVTLYTVAIMETRNAHLFGKNSPFIKAACGNYFELSKPHINSGTAAKWENMMWSIYMTDEHTLKFTVQSESVVIGHVMLRARYLCSLPIDKFGLTALEMDLVDGRKSIGSAGRIRLICRIESHFQEEDVSDDEELPDEKEARLNMVVRTDPKTGEEYEVLIPKVTHTHILGVAVRDLRNMHTFVKNSPQVIMQCGDFSEATSVQHVKGKNASWLDLAWYFYITQTSVIKLTINSGSALIGNIEMTTQELYNISPDDLNRAIIEKPIMFEGETLGYCKIQMILQAEMQDLKKSKSEDPDVDFKRFDHLADSGANMGTVILKAPVLFKVTKIVIMDVLPIHAGVVKNSPYVQLACGGFTRETSSRHRAGDSATWEGDDLNWDFVVADAKNILQITILSGWSRAGTLSILCSEVFKMPRNRQGELVLQGTLMKTYKKQVIGEEYVVSVGKVRVTVVLSPFVTEEEQKRLDREEMLSLHEKFAVPRTLAFIDILKIEVKDCVQVYGLFNNSPQVHMSFGSYMNSTSAAFDSGSNAVWDNINWLNIPIRDKSIFQADVVSGNERLGSIRMSAQEFIRSVPVAAGSRDTKGNIIMEIFGQIVDGEFAKGKIGIICRIDRNLIQVIAELQMILGSGGSLAGVQSAMTGTVATGRFNQQIDAEPAPPDLTGKDKYAYDAEDRSYNYKTSITKYAKAGFIPDGTGTGFVGTSMSLDTIAFNGSTIADNTVGGSLIVDNMLSPGGSTLDGGGFLGGQLDGHSTISNVTPGAVEGLEFGVRDKFSAMSVGDTQSPSSKLESHPDFHVSKDATKSLANTESVASLDIENLRKNRDVEDIDTQLIPLTFNANFSKSIEHIHEMSDDKDSAKDIEEPVDVEDEEDEHLKYDSLPSLIGKQSMLSNSTPTPVATRVQLMSIDASDLKHMHSFKKNNPRITLECGDYVTKTNVAMKGGQNCRWDDLSWVFVMRRMTFMRVTVHSDAKVIGSVAIGTRELLGIKKRGDKSIFRRNIEFDSNVTGKLKFVLLVDTRESIGLDETLNQQAAEKQATYKDLQLSGKLNKVALKNPPKQSLVADAVRKRLMAPIELPLTVKVVSLACIDVIPLHYVTPNSPFIQISMGPSAAPTWRKRTKRVFAAGANATWPELDWAFDVFDKGASITFGCQSGDTKAGNLVITVKELMEIPRSAQGYTEVSGKLWTDDKLIAGQVVATLLIKPFISQEIKEITKIRIEQEFRDLGKTPRLLCYISVDVVSVSEMTQMYKLLHLSASMHKWRGNRVTENTTNKNGNIVWGDLSHHGWKQTGVYEKSPFVLEIEGGKSIIGTVSITPEEIMAQPVDEEGHIVLFCDLMDGEIIVGKLSIGGTVSHELNTKDFIKRVDGKTYPVSPKRAAGGGDEDLDSSVAASPSKGIAAAAAAAAASVSTIGNATSLVEYDEASTIIQDALSVVEKQIAVKEPRWSEQVRIAMMAVDGIRNMHTLTKNQPEVKLECGDWTDTSKPILGVGSSATWHNLHFSSFRMKKRGPCEKLKIEVWSKRYLVGSAELPCELALEAPRENNRAAFEVEIQHHGTSAGKVIFEFEFLPNWAPPVPEVIVGSEIVPGAKFDLNKTVETYDKTGSHLPHEDDHNGDFTHLMDPTLLTDEQQPALSPTRPDMKLILPSSPDTGGLILPDAASVSSVSIGTGLTNQTAAVGQLAISSNSARPTTSRSAVDMNKDSGRPKTSRSSAPISAPNTPLGKTPISGTPSARSLATNDSPESTFRSESSYERTEGNSKGTTRSDYSGESWVDSRDSSARSGTETEYSDSSRSNYTDNSDTSRSYYKSDFTGRSSAYSNSSRSSYSNSSRSGYSTGSSRYGSVSSRSSRSSARTDPLTGGRTSRFEEEEEEGRMIEEEKEQSDRSGSDAEPDGVSVTSAATKGTKASVGSKGSSSTKASSKKGDGMQTNGPASLIAMQLRAFQAALGKPRAGNQATSEPITRPTYASVEGEKSFDISPLNWFGPNASRQEVTKIITTEYVRGFIGKALKMLVIEETGGDFAAGSFPIFACTDPINLELSNGVTHNDIVHDLALVTIKAAILTGGKFAINRILGIYSGVPSSFGASPFLPGGGGLMTAADFIATARSNATDATATDDDDEGPDLFVERKRPMGDQMGRRAGVLLTTGLLGGPEKAREQEEAKKEKEIDLNDTVFGKVRGHFTVPILRGLFTIHDLLGFDVSFLDKRVIPSRPYMTACKPYGDWAAETGSLWTSNRGLQEKDMNLSYRDLSGQWAWSPVNLRLGQMIIFDFHDAGSGLVFCKLRVNYEMLEKSRADENDMLTCYCEADISQEYGGGVCAGVLKCSVDISVNFWKRPVMDAEYWKEHRVQHWKTFPLIPISQGSVKSAHRHVAREYDQQRVVHPAFYGFRIRWRGNDSDESKFVNPIFMNFTLAKKPATKRMAEEAEKLNAMKSSANPWHYDVMAASLGKCPVCGDGVAGCPRCFMMPTMPDGEPLSPTDFAYDPIKEIALAAAAKARQDEMNAVRIAREDNKKKLVAAGKFKTDELDQDSDNEEDELIKKYREQDLEDLNKIDELHTKLTTYGSLRLWRNVKEKQITVLIKILPGSYIRRIQVVPEDCVATLYHRFCSHSDSGLSDSKMILLPTSVGIFEMHPEIEVADEFQNLHDPGRLPLSRYGFCERGSTITLLFMPRYMPQYTVSLLASFYERNSGFRIKHIPNYSYVDDRLPPSIHKDPVNNELSKICVNLYNIQQLDYKNQYVELGEWFRIKNKAEIEERIREAKARRQADAEEAAKRRRLESQLKGYTGAEREAKLAALLELEKMKKGNAAEVDVPQESQLAAENAEKYQTRMASVARKKARYLNRLQGIFEDSDSDEEEEEQKKIEPITAVAPEITSDDAKRNAESKGEEEKLVDDDYQYDEYSDEDESDYDSEEDDYDSAEDAEDEMDDEEEAEQPDGAQEENAEDTGIDSGRYSAQSTGRLPDSIVGILAQQHSQFPEMNEEEVAAMSRQPDSREDSRATSRGSEIVRTDSRGDDDLRGYSRGDELNLPLGDAQMTTEQIIMSKRERDKIKLIRARRARQKEDDRAYLIAEGIQFPKDFDNDEEDEDAEKFSEYSNTTGTYTERSGWSRADSWRPPSLPPGTPPIAVRLAIKKEEDDKREAEGLRRIEEAAERARRVEMGEEYDMEANAPVITSEHVSQQGSVTGSARGSGKGSKTGSKNSSRRSSKKEVEIEYDAEGNPMMPLSPRGHSTRRSSTTSTASTTTIVSTSTESTVFSENEVVPRLLFRGQNSRPSSGYSSYSGSSYTTGGSYSSRSGYSTGSYSSRSSMDTHRMGTISDSSRPSTSSTDYTSSSYYSSRPSTGSSYTDGSYSSRGGSSRFSFGTPRGSEDPDEIDFFNKYGHTGHTGDTGRSGYSSYSGSSYTSGSYSSRSGSTFTDFSAPSTERTEETQASYATFGSHKPTVDGSNPTSASTSARDKDYEYSSASTSARSEYSQSSVETTESEIKERKIRAAGGGYGKGSRKPDHRLIYKQMYGSSKGPPIPKGPGDTAFEELKDPVITSSSLSARMSARSAEGSAVLIAQGAQKDFAVSASKSQTTAASAAKASIVEKEASTADGAISNASVAAGAGSLDSKGTKKMNPKEAKKAAAEAAAAAAVEQALKEEEEAKAKIEALANRPKPTKRPPIQGSLAPISPRHGVIRLKDKRGLGEDEIFTYPSPMYEAALEKAANEAQILSLSNPNSRPGTTKTKRKKDP